MVSSPCPDLLTSHNANAIAGAFILVQATHGGTTVTLLEPSQPIERQRTMSVTQVAAVLGISRTTAYECVHSGELPALRLGGRIVVPIQAIDALLESASAVQNV